MLPDHKGVNGTNIVERSFQLGVITLRARRLFGEHALAPGRVERVDLRLRVLITGRHPRMDYQHHASRNSSDPALFRGEIT